MEVVVHCTNLRCRRWVSIGDAPILRPDWLVQFDCHRFCVHRYSFLGSVQEKDEGSGHFYNAIHRYYYDRYPPSQRPVTR